VRYGYFDPSSRSYGIATAASRHVRVTPGLLASSDTGHVEQALAIRTRYTGPVWPPIQSRPLFWAFVALAPLPAIAGRARRRARERKAASPPNPMKLLAVRPEEHPVALRRQFVRALAQRLGCSPEDFTHPGALDRALRRAGASRQTAADAEALLRSLDAAAYAGDQAALRDAAAKASAIASAVDVEALARSELPFWVPLVLICVALGFAADAMAKDLAQAEFRRGVSAYMRQDYGTARDAFASATAMAPESPDAWVNFGTTSWLVSDTSRAVFAWRQTLALEPSATDARNNLDGVREIGPSAPGWTPPLPRSASVWLFATLWFAGWGIAWAARRSRWQPFARLSLPLVTCALLVGILAIEIESRVAGNRLAVVQAATSLSVDPAIGMERGPTVATGEIVRVVGRRGTWVRVEASDDRDGWLPSNEVFLVSERRPPLN
jgi:tetratricopeptide (TPR) repeat protein